LQRTDIAQHPYAPVKPVNLNNLEIVQDTQNQHSTASFIDLFAQDAEYWDSMFSNWNNI
jgi:hypothetical protein